MPTWNNLTNTTFDEIQAGAEASLTRTLSQTDVEVLALVSGDVDPFHVAGNGAAGVRTDASTTEAAGAEALVAAVLGTRLPGPGMRILREDLRFRGRIAVRVSPRGPGSPPDGAPRSARETAASTSARRRDVVQGPARTARIHGVGVHITP